MLLQYLKISKNRRDVINKVAKSMRGWGPLYIHVEVFDGVHVLGIAIKDAHINNNNNIDSQREAFQSFRKEYFYT